MGKQDKAQVEILAEAGPGRIVGVSHASRVIFPATELTPAITKLELVQYIATMREPLMRVLHDRPTTLERWPNGVQPGMRLGRGTDDGGFYQKHMMRGAPDYVDSVEIAFPSGRTAREICPTEPAVLAWCAQMGTVTFHPWPVRRTGDPDSLSRPDELRIDLDPQPGNSFETVVEVALAAKDLFKEIGMSPYCKTSGGRGVHVFVRIQPRWDFLDVRHAAIAFGRELARRDGRVTTEWWRELRGEKIFVDFNQNCRDRTIASAWSPRARQGAPVSTPVTWSDLEHLSDPRTLNVTTVPPLLAEKGDPWQDLNDEPLLELWRAEPTEMPFPPDYPKMPGEPKRVQPSRNTDLRNPD
jgi:DNA ligase D-like protein (predicted polymerase)